MFTIEWTTFPTHDLTTATLTLPRFPSSVLGSSETSLALMPLTLLTQASTSPTSRQTLNRVSWASVL